MKEELVSIIMPSYNTARYIKESIDSVLKQTYKNFELIIVDDCSTDNTEKIVKEYKDKRIKFYKNKKNSGAAISRNKALKLAKGKWIAFLDSDDIWNENKLKKQIEFMNKNNYSFSYTNYEEIDENSENLKVYVTGPKIINKTSMYNYCWPGCLTVMYDASKIGLIQIEDLPKNNDYAIWLKIIKKTKCYLLDENLAKYRKRIGSISRNSKIKLIKYHYLLYRDGERKNILSSIILTFRNLLFGVIKKIKYVRTLKKEFSIQPIISTMNQSDPYQLLNKMNIKNSYVLINQITDKKINLTNYHSKDGYKVIESVCDRGLSKSRNLAITKIKSDIGLVCDDDMEYFDDFEDKINFAYSKYPDADVIVFNVDFSDAGYTKKIYKPRRIFYLRTMKVSSVQISFKRDSINKKCIKYDKLFGAGSKFNMGEENIFLFDCLKKKLKIYYVPYTIGKLKFEHDSTWFKGYNNAYFISRGASFYRMSKLMYIILIIQFAVRRRKLFGISVKKTIKYMFLGVKEYKKIKR